jgi:hypothetical protein
MSRDSYILVIASILYAYVLCSGTAAGVHASGASAFRIGSVHTNIHMSRRGGNGMGLGDA